jgi:LysM repeat protein
MIMARMPKRYYSLILLILTVTLAGCELRRDSSELSDPGPVSDLPPTLAPLGAETDSVAEAALIPTVIAVPLNTEQSLEAEAQVVEGSIAVTAAEQAGSSVVISEDVEEASSVAPEAFVSPAEGSSSENEVVAQEAIVVDATSDDLPIGGPVASNPPTSETGGYEAPAYGSVAYTIRPGDTLFSIAQRYGTTVDAILYANGLSNDFIQAGHVLTIPGGEGVVPQYEETPYQQPYQQSPDQRSYDPGPAGNYHVVGSGETLYRIALQYATSVDAIAGANGIPYPYIIQSGQQLVIPPPGAYNGPPPPTADGYYDQPGQGYAPQAPDNGYYDQPGQGYAPQAPDNGYYDQPGGAGTHTVGPGETLYSIALNYGTSAEALASSNGLLNPNQIYVGQVLYLP